MPPKKKPAASKAVDPEKLTVPKLKAELKKLGLEQDGLKAVLVARLKEALGGGDAPEPAPESPAEPEAKTKSKSPAKAAKAAKAPPAKAAKSPPAKSPPREGARAGQARRRGDRARARARAHGDGRAREEPEDRTREGQIGEGDESDFVGSGTAEAGVPAEVAARQTQESRDSDRKGGDEAVETRRAA